MTSKIMRGPSGFVRILFWALFVLAVLSTFLLSAFASPSLISGFGLLGNSVGELVALGAFIVLWVAFYFYWRKLFPKYLPQLKLLLIVVVNAVVLGFFSYLAATDVSRILTVFMGIFNLFTGQVEDGIFEIYPLPFQVARLMGLSVTFGAAVQAISTVFFGRFAYKRAREAEDIDIVTPLIPEAMPLISALLAEAEHPRSDGVFEPLPPRSWKAKISGGRIGKPKRRVVVVDPAPSADLVQELRFSKVLVVADHPEAAVDLAISGFGKDSRIGLRRLFAVSRNTNQNLKVVEAFRESIETFVSGKTAALSRRTAAPSRVDGAARSPIHMWQSLPNVPRLIARFEDAREARDWRLSNCHADGCYLDSISVDELMAREIVQAIVTHHQPITELVCFGDSPLIVAVLDELTRQLYFRQELAVADEQARNDEWAQVEEHPQLPPMVAVKQVHVVDPRAQEIIDEWQVNCPPAGYAVDEAGHQVSVFAFVAHTGDDVMPLVAKCPAGAWVICGEPNRELSARATRIARTAPYPLVFCPDAVAIGLESIDRPPVGEAVDSVSLYHPLARYRPALTQLKRVPDDSWTQLARQTHDYYRFRYPNADPEAYGRQIWEDGPGGLVDFMREDNIRQLRQVLSATMSLGRVWRPAILGHAKAPDDEFVSEVARLEHIRWADLRVLNRWSCPDQAESGVLKGLQDRQKKNDNLIDWETGAPLGLVAKGVTVTPKKTAEKVRNSDTGSVKAIFERLFDWGIMPVDLPVTSTNSTGKEAEKMEKKQRFVRTGRATGQILTEDREWATQAGDVLHGVAGDWLVTTPDGGQRTVTADEFSKLYQPLDPGQDPKVAGEYQRKGWVWAYQLTEETKIVSLEGEATGRVGDWAVTDPRGNSWPVPDEVFRSSYRLDE